MLHVYIISTHVYVYVYINVCVHMLQSVKIQGGTKHKGLGKTEPLGSLWLIILGM